MNNMRCDHQVFVQEFDRITHARLDPADVAGEVENEIDRIVSKEFLDRRLIA
jgi:hypothetical protein